METPSRVWVNSKWLTSENPKLERRKDNPSPLKEKTLWGLCASCGGTICEGDSVGMYGEHAHVVCYTCFGTGEFSDHHCDCAGLKLPEATLSN